MSDNPFQDVPDDNPYVSPFAPAESTNPLLIPAIVLLVLSIVYLLLLVASLPGQIVEIRNTDPSTPEGQGKLVGQIGFLIAIFVVEVGVIIGSISMLRMKGYRNAVLAAILSMVPLCSPCFVLGIPFGIWAFVLLQKPDVKGRFT